MTIRTVRYRDMNLDKPIAIVGFPGAGLVSSIASNFYVGQLDMTAIAGMSSEDMPPYCLISRGQAYPPIRFYGYKGTGKTSKDVIVCMSEYAPKPEQCHEVAHGIINYLKRMGCENIICLEGIPRYSLDEAMVACGSGPGAIKMIKRSKVTVMDGGMVRGITGIMLYDGPNAGLNVVALICPANQNVPDPGSAANFMVPLSRMIPGLKVNTKPLIAEADEIQKHLEEQSSIKESDQHYYG